MPLTNRYIKYTPEITMEIFKLILDKLKGLSIVPVCKYSMDKRSYLFKEYGHIIIEKVKYLTARLDDDPKYINFTEISVQDFLGYDPFKKPIEKWAIGSYVLFLKPLDRVGVKGFIDVIDESLDGIFSHLKEYKSLNTTVRENQSEIKWFPTLKEAEEYRDNFLFKSEPIKSEILPKYKIGDKVRLTSVRPVGWNSEGKMDKYLGKDVVIRRAGERCFEFEGDGDWVFNLSDIVGFTSDFKATISDVKVSEGLPEKWCIKLVSREINDAVNSIKLWNSGNRLTWDNTTSYTNHFIGSDGEYSPYLNTKGYIEITFDQFKTHVLENELSKEPIETTMKTTVEDFYIQCASVEESQLCVDWCKRNGYHIDECLIFTITDWFNFVFKNGRGQVNDKHTHGLQRKTIDYVTPKIKVEEPKVIADFPKTWHIKVNSENREELGKWRTIGTIVGDLYCLSEGHPAGHLSHKGYCMSKAPSNSQEITTEQFRKYVLGKSSEITPPIQLEPVHVETGEFKVGDWVKITKSDQNWDDSMDEYVGMVVQLSSLGASTSKYTFFHIKEDEGHWSWCYEQGHFKKVDVHVTSISSGVATFDGKSDCVRDLDIPFSISISYNGSNGRIAPGTADLSNWGVPSEPPSYMAELELDQKYKDSLQLVLSTNDEELPMVSIIKTNTIKQLLNLD